MKPEIAKLWCDALRSKKYKQGKNCLRNDTDQYCCLGVLCDLHSKHTGRRWALKGYVFHYCGSIAALPVEVRQWAGLKSKWGEIDSTGTELTTMNDTGRRFATIAKVIEKHVDEL